MIKREFRTLEFFLDSFTEKELPPATKLIIASRLKETFSKITDFDKIQKDNLCNNAIINSHEKKHQIFGVYLNNCGKCLKNFEIKLEDPDNIMKDNCDLCFRNDNFHIFYLECLGCQSKICTLCASNISDDKNLPCLKCGKELISFKSSSKIKEMTCEFCLNVSNTYIFCDYCKINICKVCEEIILIKIFLRVSSKKIKTQNEKIMIEKKIEELFSKSMIHDSSKFKFNIEGYLLQTFDILLKNYIKYDICTIKSFLKDQALTYSSLNSVNGVSNAHSESHVDSDIDIKIDCKESFEGEAQIIQEIKKVYFPQDQYNNNSPSKNENTILSNLSKNKKIDFNFNSEKTIPGIQFLNQNIISSNKNKLDSPKFFNESNKNDIWEKYHASIIDKLEGIDINDSPNCRTMKNVQFSGLEKSNYISEFQEKTIASAGSLYSSNNNFKKMELTNSNYQPNQEKTIPNVLSSQNEVAYSRESYNQSVFTPNNQNESLNQKNSNDLFYINGLNQEISNLFITLQKKPSKNLNKLLSNFELNFEKLCLENDFTEINNETLNLFTTSDSGEFEIIYQPDQYQDELYTNKTVTATMKKLIGSGGYGNVYDFSIKDSLNNYENDKVVGKMFQLNQNSKNDFFFGFNSFLKEWKVLRLFEHENIIKVLGILYRTDLYDSLYNVGILLEKMDCTLEEYLKEMKNYLDFDERLGLALQIVNGLSYIHDKHRIHRDIKPGNILVYEEKQLVKLIDFGTISEDIVESKLIMDDAFTISYAPPEFIRYYYLNEKVQLDFGSDIWSLGVTLFEIFSKNSNLLNFPWVMLISDFEMKNMDSEKLTDSLNKKSLVLEMDEKELQDFVNEKLQNNIQNIKLKELLSKCFLMKPDQRIRIGDLMKELQNLRKTAFHERYEDERIEIRKKSIKSQKSSPNKLKFEKDEEKMNEESLKIIEESQIKKKEIMNNAIKRKNKF